MKTQNNLIAPSEYWNLIRNKNHNNTNCYCGTGITAHLVPDNLFGVNISEACSIHDFMYGQGKDKKHADKIFLKNMIELINQDSDARSLKSLRKAKAYIYYFAVKLFGSSFFRASTN